jgi:hypothetical protein
MRRHRWVGSRFENRDGKSFRDQRIENRAPAGRVDHARCPGIPSYLQSNDLRSDHEHQVAVFLAVGGKFSA